MFMPGTLQERGEKHVSHERASADVREAAELIALDSGMNHLRFVRSKEADLGAVGKK
jgi:hypothetical protein